MVLKVLSLEQMTKRILTNIPELDYSFVKSTLQKDCDFGFEQMSVQDWLYYFDSIVIDGMREIHEKS